jgi:hypothetical protein
MPCPYFYPVERLDEALWAVPPRLPLLDAYRGECRAAAAPQRPADDIMRGVCNSGYGRGKCPNFPPEARADAVRFHVAEDGETVRLQYLLEKECRPVDHGELQYSVMEQCFASAAVDGIVARQAAVFVDSYLRRVHDNGY